MKRSSNKVNRLLRKAVDTARKESRKHKSAELQGKMKWPVDCTVGPGLEGAIACETKIGYVNGTKGQLLYQGYDIFDLCAESSFEEVSYLLLHERLPTRRELEHFNKTMINYRALPNTIRRIMSVPLEEMHPMAALRLATNFMRHRLTWRDSKLATPIFEPIAADEDSIPMETKPSGESHAIYEFKKRKRARPQGVRATTDDAASIRSCIHLISGLATMAAAIGRLRRDLLPIDPDPELSHAANFLYMMTGKRPSPEEERVMDVTLILQADHGINASTFASLVVASTMSDIYFSIGSGIAALSGPLHGGANEAVVNMLESIGGPEHVEPWLARQIKAKRKIPGFGHRVYKTYDPRARILGPLVKHLAQSKPEIRPLYETARKLEKLVVDTLGKEKGVFPNVDFYSGLLYRCLEIPTEMFPCMFAVSRVAGWTARVLEYLKNNRIFRPRAWYVGTFDRKYIPIRYRRKKRKSGK